MAEEAPLKRILDYKLLFDCLADSSNGKISVHTLAARWPTKTESRGSKLPRGCVDEWRVVADKEGYLNWEAFSSGLAKALKKNASYLSKKPTQSEAERILRSLRGSEGHSSIGETLLTSPVEASDIEAFLVQCEGQSLVQVLARTKKEVYSCQTSLQQQQQQKTVSEEEHRHGIAGEGTVSNEAGKQQKSSSDKDAAGKTTPSMGMVGNEKEELLKGVEILKQTQQWFRHRLEQLELEKSTTKKPSAEELLAIMEGSSTHPAAHTLHHIQKINAHLSSLALHAPSLISSSTPHEHSQRWSSAGERKEHRVQRLRSDPGAVVSSSKGREGHRHSHTSPPSTTTAASTITSGAHVIGIDIPSPSPDTLGIPGPHIGRYPHRSHSFQEGRLKQTAKRNVSSPDKHKEDKRYKPQRSHSFNQQSPGGHVSDLGPSSTARIVTDYTTADGHMHSYPLRESVSLNQLPGGVGGYAVPRQPPISHGMSGQGHPPGMQGIGSGLVYTSLKSSSTMSLPSGDSLGHHGHKQRHRSNRSLKRELEKEQLRAKQVAAHQYILQTEVYQGSTGSDRNQSTV